MAGHTRWRAAVALGTLVALGAVAMALPGAAAAEDASEPGSAAARQLDAGANHSCALQTAGTVRCWGFGADGRLGYGNTTSVGDDETPASAGPVDVGGAPANAIAAGDGHTCAVLDGGSVRCWGFGDDGRLGYPSRASIGDDEPPASAGPVDLGVAPPVKAISAGGHTCALFMDGTVRCWGFGLDGRLGYGNFNTIGDNETPGSAGPVNLGAGRTAVAVSAGGAHTCAVLDNGTVRCWGLGTNGRLGYLNDFNVGNQQTPGAVGPVDLGSGHTAKAISAGGVHTCVVLDDDSVRCWGYGGHGRLGYGNTSNIGDNETPGSAGPVNLGPGRTAKAISAGEDHTCALLDDDSVRCWGRGTDGRPGYANTANIGDDETPGSAGPVNLGPGRTAVAISAGGRHTCARLDDGTVRCWGYGENGRLGYCSRQSIGDDETPAAAGPVDLGSGGAGCATGPIGDPTADDPTPPSPPPVVPEMVPDLPAAALAAPPVPVSARAVALRRCLSAVTRHASVERARARRSGARTRARILRHLDRHASSGRRRCLRLHGRTPGAIAGLRARALGSTRVELSFLAPGTDRRRPPPAHSYLVKQSLRPILNARDFARAPTLCRGSCRVTVSSVGERITLTVTDLRPGTTYYYALAARDNVSARPGRRSPTVRQETPRGMTASA